MIDSSYNSLHFPVRMLLSWFIRCLLFTANLQNRFLKSVKIRKHIYLAFRCECSSPFQGTAARKVQLSTAHGQLYRSLKASEKLIWESPTKEDTNFHGHQLTLLSVQNSNRMASRLTAIAVFSSVFFFSIPVIFEATSKIFGSLGCSNDKNWLDLSSIFCKICRFRSSILLWL